jgi:hypothetical protein
VEIACIVEGDGEKAALPVLLRRILEEIEPSLVWAVRIHAPIRRPRDQLRKQDVLTGVVNLAARQFTSRGAVLILIDADDACPALAAPEILAWAQAARSDISMSVVLANAEYEAWFLAAAESLRGHRGLPDDLTPPRDPDAVSGAKEWLSRHMPRGESYSPTSHQASFSAAIDLEMARQRAPSFDKLCRDVRRLVDALRAGEGER